VLYIYDNTFDGLLTAIFDIYASGDSDAIITSSDQNENISLYGSKNIVTDPAKSARVQKGLRRLGPDVSVRMYKAWLSRSDGVEDLMLAVMRIGFAAGKDPFALRHHDVVCRLDGICRKVGWEAERMLQFVRFIKLSEDMYAADIEPEYDVLELIGDHFHERFPRSRFIIRDLRHRRAIVSTSSGWHITFLPEGNPPLPKDGEYENLWKTYFKTIANESRINLRLQQHHVPLKYRKHLTEFN